MCTENEQKEIIKHDGEEIEKKKESPEYKAECQESERLLVLLAGEGPKNQGEVNPESAKIPDTYNVDGNEIVNGMC